MVDSDFLVHQFRYSGTGSGGADDSGLQDRPFSKHSQTLSRNEISERPCHVRFLSVPFQRLRQVAVVSDGQRKSGRRTLIGARHPLPFISPMWKGDG